MRREGFVSPHGCSKRCVRSYDLPQARQGLLPLKAYGSASCSASLSPSEQ